METKKLVGVQLRPIEGKLLVGRLELKKEDLKLSKGAGGD